jgi:hypothetical protein
MKEPIETHCPICGAAVTRVVEMTAEECHVESDCTSEYWIHKGNKLIKLIGPTPTDTDMKRELAKKH